MDILVLLAATFLFAQGVSIVAQKGTTGTRLFGILTLGLSVLGLAGFHMYTLGHFLMSPAFGVVLAEGPVAWLGLVCMLVAISIIAGLGMRIARVHAGWDGTIPWFIGAGLLIGILASLTITSLNEGELHVPTIYAYDLWSPLLMLWVTVCLLETFFLVAHSTNWLNRAMVWSAVAAGVAWWALRQPAFFYDGPISTAQCWRLILLAAPAISLGIGLWILLTKVRPKKLSIMLALAGLAIAAYSILAGMTWVLVSNLTHAGARKLLEQRRDIFSTPPTRLFAKKACIFVALVALGLSVYALLYSVAPINKAGAIAAVFVSWAVLADFVAGVGLIAWSRALLAGNAETRSRFKNIAEVIVGGAKKMVASVTNVFGADKWPAVTLKLLLGLMLLVVLAELPNAGKKIVEPFTISGSETVKGADIADRVVHEIRSLSQEIVSDVLVHNRALKTGPEDQSTATQETNTAVNDLAKSGAAVSIGDVEIPMHLFLWPIQSPLRWILDVEIVTGQLYMDDTSFKLTAQSSKGQVWQESSMKPPSAGGDEEAALPSSLDAQTQKLAFGILMSSEWAMRAGLTQSWEAFTAYREGLAAFRYVEQRRTFHRSLYAKLQDAIDSFREAITHDSGFTLAHYRLGHALQLDKQSQAAQAAFQNSRVTGRNFVQGTNALAASVFNENLYQPPASAIAPFKALDVRHRKARELWQYSINTGGLSDQLRAFAYAGLGRSYGKDDPHGPNTFTRLIAYYYLSRAVQLFDGLPPELAEIQAIRLERVQSLNELGNLLASAPGPFFTVDGWHCYDDGRIPFLWHHSAYTKYSLERYREAVAIVPDDITVRCNEAAAALALNIPEPMQVLSENAEALLLRATYASTIESKLGRLETLIRIHPEHLGALNSYAYTLWQWHARNPGEPLDLEFAHFAEQAVRKARRVADAQENENALQYTSTLAEILLLQNRPHEALDLLQQSEPDLPLHPDAHEIRWDLAQAMRCVAAKEQAVIDQHGEDPEVNRTTKRVDKMIAASQEILNQIGDIDGGRERSLYLDDPSILHVDKNVHLCSIPSSANVLLYEYELGHGPDYLPSARCGSSTLSFELASQHSEEDVYLHAWGLGLHSTLDPGPYSLVVATQANNTRDRYFAQLWRRDTNAAEERVDYPVSSVVSIPTYSACDKSSIHLMWQPIAGGAG